MVKVKLNSEKLFFSTLIASAGMSAAIVLNSLLQYRYFSLPHVKYEEKTYYHLKPKNKGYSSIKYLFLTDKSSNVSKRNSPVSTVSNISGIKLMGIIGSKDGKIALFRKNENILFLKEGDKLAGFTLKKVNKFSVILEKDGKKIELSIELKSNGFSTQKITKTTIQKNKTKNIPVRYKGDTIQVDKRFIEEKTADIGAILKDIMIVPVVKNDETVGYRFKYIKPGSILYKLGLRSGDMVVSINDMPVKTAEDAFKLYNMLRNESNIKVVVERNNQRKVLNYEIR